MNASISDYIKSGALYALPHHLISRSVFKLTRIKSPLVPKAIELFSQAFKVDLNEAVNPDPNSYATFNSLLFIYRQGIITGFICHAQARL